MYIYIRVKNKFTSFTVVNILRLSSVSRAACSGKRRSPRSRSLSIAGQVPVAQVSISSEAGLERGTLEMRKFFFSNWKYLFICIPQRAITEEYSFSGKITRPGPRKEEGNK